MAVIRINPATALSQLRQVGNELRRLVVDAAPLASAPALPLQLERFDQACATPVLEVAVWNQDGSARDAVAAWLLGAPPESWSEDGARASGRVGDKRVQLTFGASGQVSKGVSGEIGTALVVWQGAETGASAAQGLDDAPVVIVTRPIDGCGTPQIVVDEAKPGVLPSLLRGSSPAPMLDLVQADAAAATLERLTAVAGLAFEQEARSTRAKRALAQDRLSAVQGKATPVSTSDLLSGLRSRLQRTFADFMRGLEERFDTTIAAPTAPLWAAVDSDLAAIAALEEEARVKTVGLKVSAAAEASWLERVRGTLTQHCLADRAAVRDMLKDAAAAIEKDVADAGGPPLVVQFQQLTDQRLNRVLDNALVPQRRYQGELPQQGFFQYLMMARRYQTVAFMLMSAFGLSFVRSYREFMLPAAVMLLSFGAVQVVHSVKRERVEMLRRELEKVRDLLRAETRRMTKEVESGWLGVVNQHLADQLPHALGAVEAAVREHAARTAGEGAEDKQRLQRQVQSSDSAEKKLLALQKSREGIAQGLAQVRGELRTMVAAAARGAAV
jgi:hypothetical protein